MDWKWTDGAARLALPASALIAATFFPFERPSLPEGERGGQTSEVPDMRERSKGHEAEARLHGPDLRPYAMMQG